MHDLSSQQPRIPHYVHHVPATPLRASGYEVRLTHNGKEYPTGYAPDVTGALNKAEGYIRTHFPRHIL